MNLENEPVRVINAISTIAVGVLPVLAIFGILDWSLEQFGAVEGFIILVTATLATLFTRARVTPYNGE